MCAKKRTSLLLLTALIGSAGFHHAAAQVIDEQYGPKSTKESSPYSRFGIGNLNNSTNTLIRAEGGAATAFNDIYSVNSFNPASYGFLKATTIDFALEARSNSVLMDDKTYASGTATFSYLDLGIPLGKYMGMDLGFKPISKMYYSANDTADVSGVGSSVYSYNGSGGMQLAYVGFSGAYKGFSAGFNFGYAFGSFNYANSFSVLDSGTTQPSMRNVEFSSRDQAGGLYWKGGLLYRLALKEKHYLSIGATFTLAQQLNVKRNSYDIAYQVVTDATGSGIAQNIDTIRSTIGKKGTLELPLEYSFGINYQKSFHWNIGADFTYRDWSSFQKMGDRTGVADQSWRASLGGGFTPDPEGNNKNYFSIITYRLGAYYGKDNLYLNGTDIDFVGGTVGASFPLKRNYNQFGRINTALDIGTRGTVSNGLAREFFVKFTVGISLNDIWFIRPKYD